MLSPLACLPRDYRVFRISFTFLKTQHFAAYVELHITGGASTVQVEAVVCTTLTAHSEPYNRGGIHASLLEPSANALHDWDWGKRCAPTSAVGGHRWRRRIVTGKANVFGLCSGAPPFVPERKTRSLGCPRGWLRCMRHTDFKHQCGVETATRDLYDLVKKKVIVSRARGRGWHFITARRMPQK